MYIHSPEQGCGKTRVLEVAKLVTRRARQAASVTQASVFQTIERYQPTLLIDEVDGVFTARSERAEDIRVTLKPATGLARP